MASSSTSTSGMASSSTSTSGMASSSTSGMASSSTSTASASSSSISGLEKEKKVSLRNLLQEIVDSKSRGLKRLVIGVMGDDETGRHTLIRRFRHMIDGPFGQPEDSGNKKRGQQSKKKKKEDEERVDILVALNERPYLTCRDRMVRIRPFIFHFHELDFKVMYKIVRELDSFVVIFDVGRGSTLYPAIYCMVQITDFLRGSAPDFVLVGNKTDLPRREVSSEKGVEVADACKAERYYECSALMNVNMDSVLDALLIIGLDLYMSVP